MGTCTSMGQFLAESVPRAVCTPLDKTLHMVVGSYFHPAVCLKRRLKETSDVRTTW